MSSKKNPRILHIITGLNTGGAEQMLLKVIRYGPAAIEDTHVFSLSDERDLYPMFEQAGISVRFFNFRTRNPFVLCCRLLSYLGALLTLRPRVIVGWMYHGNFAATVAKLCLPFSRVYWGVRVCNPFSTNASRGMKALNRFLSMMSGFVPEKIIYNTQKGIRNHVQAGYDPGKSVMVNNGFDLDKFSPSHELREKFRRTHDIPHGAFVFGMVANWHPRKNFSLFVESAGRVGALYPNAFFVLAGRGVTAENEELMQLVEQTQMAERFRLLGSVSKMEEVYPAFNVFCLSSFYEGFPNVIGEAMACALPCVTTEAGDAPEVVGDCGCVVQGYAVEDYVRAMESLVTMDEAAFDQLSREARERVAGCYAIRGIAEAFYRVIMPEA